MRHTFTPYALALLLGPVSLAAATLPAHRPLRILIVSDAVNPHGLPPGDLTEPGDLSTALLDPASGLTLDASPDALLEIPTNQIEDATARLDRSRCDPLAYDVLVYFAHRIPDNGNDPTGRQAAFTSAVERFLDDGGGVVSFHHGVYLTTGKEGILDLIGASAWGAVPWNTTEGQDVIAVAPGHFVTTNGLSYPSFTPYGDPARGVPSASYPYFNNAPDERYPWLEINPTAGDFTVLFASDYVDNGTSHVLSFMHRRPSWLGVVIGYQPGEYQPNALNLTGNNFQILANAIVHAASALLPGPADDALLRVARGPAAGEVALSWTSGSAYACVHRATDPTLIGAPAGLLGGTRLGAFSDVPPVVTIQYYQVLAP